MDLHKNTRDVNKLYEAKQQLCMNDHSLVNWKFLLHSHRLVLTDNLSAGLSLFGVKDSTAGCWGSEQRALRGSFLHFKIYSPNQTLAFGWKCSVNDVMKVSPLGCCDLSHTSGVSAEPRMVFRGCLVSPPPSPLVTKTNKCRIFWMLHAPVTAIHQHG